MRRLGPVLAAVLIGGCGGSGSGGGDSGLGAALDRVSGGDAAKAYVEWADVAALRELAKVEPRVADFHVDSDDRWARVIGLGAGRLAQSGVAVAEQTGIDFLAADEALTLGEPPDTATVLRGDGLDTGAIRGKLEDAGAKEEDGKLAFGEEGEVDVDSPFAQLGLLNDLNRVALDDGVVAFGPTSAAVDEAAGDGDGSALDEHQGGVDCLGDDIVAAQLYADEVALGVRRDGHEVVCVNGGDEDALREGFGPDAISNVTRQKMSTLVAKADVDSAGDWARAVLTPADGRPAGFVFDAYRQRDLPGATTP